MTIEDAQRWMGQPVCVVLNDRSYYVGWITEVDHGGLTLSGQRGQGKISSSSIHAAEKGRLSGFFPGAQAPPFGGGWGGDLFGFNPAAGGVPAAGGFPAGQNAPVNGGGGFMGMLGKVWPGIKMGFGMLQMIMPLLGGLKI